MLDKKIAIIGAGPSGLGAAQALREKGYTNITVFEKSDCAGGLSLSRQYVTPDQRTITYDLGSVQPVTSKILKRLFRSHGLQFGRGPLEKKTKVIYAYSYIHNTEFANFVKYALGAPVKYLPLILADLAKLGFYLWRYRRLAQPGFHGFKYIEETSVDIRTWVDARKFKFLGEKLVPFIVSALTLNSKSRESQVGMYMVFKALYLLTRFPNRYIDGSYRPVRQGFQELWKRLAKNFDVAYNADITSITRDGNGVTVTTAAGQARFDALIVSCTFDKVAHLFEASAAEGEVFKNFYFNPGYRGAFIAKNGPIDSVHWYPDSYTTGKAPPYLTFAIPEGQVDGSAYLYSCMFSACPTGREAVPSLQASAEKMFREQYDAEITEWVAMKYWPDYGCVYDIAMVKAGVFDKIEALQGSNHTYYTGQLLSLNGHANAVEYSYGLVDRFF